MVMANEERGRRERLSAPKAYAAEPTGYNPARIERTESSEQQQILQDSIIGQKATAEGTAGTNGEDVPTGTAAREGHGKGQA